LPQVAADLVSQALAAPADAETSTSMTTTTAAASPPTAEVASARSEARAVVVPTQPSPLAQNLPQTDPSPGLSLPWLIGIALLVGGLGGAYLQNKHAAK
jgi:hypothetical protein